MAINWSDDLAIGIADIDMEHREIFRRYISFLDACKAGKGRDGLLELLDFLVDYVSNHFSREEKLMREYSYPDLDSHLGEHEDLTRMVLGFKRQLTREGPSISLTAEINRKILDWLLGHIKKTDMALGSFLNQKWGLF